jgi:succinoglycan biosynthesis protein ExoA
MSVLVVIPCLNEADHIGALLDQLLADLTVTQIVVADGGSTDGSREIILERAKTHPRLKLLDNPARIQSAGVNLAVATYGETAEWILRVDAHCLYPDNYAQTLLRAVQEQNADCVVVPMVTQGVSGFQLAVAAAQNSPLGTGGSAHRHVGEGQFVDHGHHALMRRESFQNAGGYCEAMPCNEDAELDHRMTQNGARIWLEPSGALTYFPRRTISSLWRQYFKYGVGRARNLRRHKMRPHLRQILPLAVPGALILALLTPFHAIFALPLLAWALLCLGLGAIIGLRKGGGWRLLTGVAAGIMHMSWGLGFIWEMLRNPGGTPPQHGLRP